MKIGSTRIRLFFAWFDMWIGMYWSKKRRTLYVCLLPMVVLSFEFGYSNDLWEGMREAMERASEEIFKNTKRDPDNWIQFGNERIYARDPVVGAADEVARSILRCQEMPERKSDPVIGPKVCDCKSVRELQEKLRELRQVFERYCGSRYNDSVECVGCTRRSECREEERLIGEIVRLTGGAQ